MEEKRFLKKGNGNKWNEVKETVLIFLPYNYGLSQGYWMRYKNVSLVKTSLDLNYLQNSLFLSIGLVFPIVEKQVWFFP